MTILLVEDDDRVRVLVARVLRRLGYDVLEAESVPAARAIGASRDAIDLLVTDVVVRGATGPRLWNELSDRLPKLRRLYISGYSRELASNCGVGEQAPFLQRPFSPAVLGERVREVLADGRETAC